MFSPSTKTLPPTGTKAPLWLPWVLGLLALGVYGLTLPARCTLEGTDAVASVCGWEWRQPIVQPLYQFFLAIFHIFPPPCRIVALNWGNATLAALILGLLARVIQLWPQDQTPDLRAWQPVLLGGLSADRLAWVGPVAGVSLLALAFPFWEQATVTTGKLLTLLIEVWTIRCLLEYRLNRQPKWLLFMSLAYGMGLANDWELLILLPLLLLVLIWVIRYWILQLDLEMLLESLLNGPRPDWRPFAAMTVGFFGFPLWLLVLPFIYWLTSFNAPDLWICVKASLKWYQSGLMSELHLLQGEARWVILGITSFIPLGMTCWRWHDETSPEFSAFFRLAQHFYWLVHLLLALVSGLILLGSIISPDNFIPSQPMLLGYLLSAIVFGHSLNYLIRRLLGWRILERPFTTLQWSPWTNTILLWALLLGTAGMIGNLALRNERLIWLDNQVIPAKFRDQVLRSLPEGPKVLIASDARWTTFSRVWLQDTPAGKDTVFLDLSACSYVAYHRHQMDNYTIEWRNTLGSLDDRIGLQLPLQDQLLQSLAVTRKIFSLQPIALSPFDSFAPHPYGTVFQLDWCNNPPPPEPADSNEIWNSLATSPDPGLTNAVPSYLRPSNMFSKKNDWGAMLTSPPPRDLISSTYALYLSELFDTRGVDLQRAGRWSDAAPWFQLALQFNPENSAAQLNQDFNSQRTQGHVASDSGMDTGETSLPTFRTVAEAVHVFGPIDIPTYLMALGRACYDSGLYAQARSCYQRTAELAPANWLAQCWLASLNLRLGLPQDTLSALRHVRPLLEANGAYPYFATRLELLQAGALLALKQPTEASAPLEKLINDSAADPQKTINTIDSMWGKNISPEALPCLDDLVRRHPQQAAAYVLRGLVLQSLERWPEAEQDFRQAVALCPASPILRFRHGCVLLAAGHIPEAKPEFAAQLQLNPQAFRAHFALAKIALHEKDEASARSEFQAFLAQADEHEPDYATASQALGRLK